MKRFLPDLLVLLLFIVAAFAYFYPADTEGRILYRHDSSAGRGLGEETAQYARATGEQSRWTGAAFSGMPTYQSAPSYESGKTLAAVTNAYHLWLPENVWYVFAYLLGFYIMLRAFDFRWYLAMLGAVAWAFSSYFLIIIAAGHIWKVMALAYLPPMIAGVVLCYRRRLLPGFLLTAVFAAFEVAANHVQMTYYYLFIIAALVIAFLVEAIRSKTLPQFAKATAVCALAALLGIAANLPNLYHTWQYQKESMRGKSELVKADAGNQTASGLDRDYITQWSYGIDETWTLLIPNTKGGSSMTPVSQAPQAAEHADQAYMDIYEQMGQYWGEQPGTSGPVYVGAAICFLFVLALFIVQGPVKWALLAATLLSFALSWGHNMMWLTDLFLDYVPMYAKFRTVASILVIAEFTIPLLALLALRRLLEEPDCVHTTVRGRRVNWLYVAYALAAGVCVLFAIAPAAFFDTFVSTAELRALAGIPQEQLTPLLANLTEVRQAMFSADCWRSAIVITLAAAVIIACRKGWLARVTAVVVLILICAVDMWQVDKRYLNDGMFVAATVRDAPVEPTATDQAILQDKSPSYRVLNFASNTFNENETSYFHKSIGGYHAAKLRRYQELIDAHIAPEMSRAYTAIAKAGGDMTQVQGDTLMPVINMLNARYLILPLEGGRTMPVINPYAMGNAWFVASVKQVANANEELDALARVDLHRTAVTTQPLHAKAAQGNITLTTYRPNELRYTATSPTGGLAVFSEIYYPGWTATVDGTPADIARVNYVLRAITLPPGKHNIVMEFRPDSIATTETIAYAALAIMLLALIAAAIRRLKHITTKTNSL